MYQNHRSKHVDFLYRYPISYRNAKKATTGKRIYPFENDITDFFTASELKIHSSKTSKRQRYCRLRKEHLWHFYRFDAFGGGRDRGFFINKAAGMKSQMRLEFLELKKIRAVFLDRPYGGVMKIS